MRDDYGDWLKAQGYAENSCNSRPANVRTVERAYGESLDDIIARGGLGDLVAELTYSKSDERHGRPNPSRAGIQGNLFNGLATLKGAVTLYNRFIGAPWEESDDDEPDTAPDNAGRAAEGDQPGLEKQRLSLERDMERFLREDISRLEPVLTIIDAGAQRSVLSGSIDILARDASGATVVIELKAGKTDERVIGQVLGYMGDIADEDEPEAVRGIIVAHVFDQRTRSAARAVPSLTLMRYAVSFTFEPEAQGMAGFDQAAGNTAGSGRRGSGQYPLLNLAVFGG